MTLSDLDLLTRLRKFEDPFSERKAASDISDVLKTAVAFANTLPIDIPGVIFIPAKDDGSIQDNIDLDDLQKKITRRLNNAYPPLPTTYRVLRSGEQQVVAIMVFGSKDRPHFSGPAFVRRGSETRNASESEFASLIAQRSSKSYEISKWIGKRIRVKFRTPPSQIALTQLPFGELLECTAFYVVVNIFERGPYSASLSNIEISFDPGEKCLVLEIEPGRA